MNLSEVPDITVPLSVGGYIGFTLLGLLALVVLILATLVIPHHSGGGFVIAGIGTAVFMYPAFAYLRTVEMGWHLPNVGVWAGLLASGVVATVVANYIDGRLGSVAGASVGIPFAGVFIGTVIAGVFDALNEILGGIPLTWGAVILMALVAVVFVMDRR